MTSSAPSSQSPALLIACYCAAWCDTCRSYQTDFNALAGRWPQHRFVWIDIEEHPELLDDHDVENFPTILIQNERGTVFFGVQLPYVSHLERLIGTLGDRSPLVDSAPGLLHDRIQDL